MSQSLTQCRVAVPTNLNSSQRAIIGEIIIREIRARTRRGQGPRQNSRFAPYSLGYLRNLRRARIPTTLDLQRTGQMLGALRVLEHGRGFILVGISSMDREAFAKARYTQGEGRGPARKWLAITQGRVNEIVMGLRQADGEGADVPLDILPDADRAIAQRVGNQFDVDRAGETRQARLLRIQNQILPSGLSESDRQAILRDRRRRDRLERTSDDALNIAAQRFIRGGSGISRDLPVFATRFRGEDGVVQTTTRGIPRADTRRGVTVPTRPRTGEILLPFQTNAQATTVQTRLSEQEARRQAEIQRFIDQNGVTEVDPDIRNQIIDPRALAAVEDRRRRPDEFDALDVDELTNLFERGVRETDAFSPPSNTMTRNGLGSLTREIEENTISGTDRRAIDTRERQNRRQRMRERAREREEGRRLRDSIRERERGPSDTSAGLDATRSILARLGISRGEVE